MTIPNFSADLDLYEPSLRQAAEAAEAFASASTKTAPETQNALKRTESTFKSVLDNPNFGKNEPWLTLSGLNGCGKTHLARRIYAHAAAYYPYSGPVWVASDSRRLNSRRPQCVWLDEVEFVHRCKNGEYDLPQYLGDDWLVVIDDLGASRDKSGFAGEMIFKLCNSRVGKLTLFTTNLTLPQISEQIDPRIASRLIRDGNKFLRIKAGDYAMRPKTEMASP